MRHISTKYIFSAERVGAKDNDLRTKELLYLLQDSGVPFAFCTGVYKGNQEVSFLVEGYRWREDILRLARLYGQESVLEIHPDGGADLVFLDGSPAKPIGTIREVASVYGHDSATLVNDRCYVVG